MSNGSVAFVFDSVEAAQAAVRRLNDAKVDLAQFSIDTDTARYGIPSVYPAGQCILLLHLKGTHDEAYISELVRGAGRLIPVLAPESEYLSLDVEHLRTENLWRSITEQKVPLTVAAAMTFHEAHRNAKAIVSRSDYNEALNIAASALSRLVRIYTPGAITQKQVEVQVNLLSHRFALGASQLRSRNGEGLIEPLFVHRGDLLFALSVVKRAGLPFSFALLPLEEQSRALEHPELPKDETWR